MHCYRCSEDLEGLDMICANDIYYCFSCGLKEDDAFWINSISEDNSMTTHDEQQEEEEEIIDLT